MAVSLASPRSLTAESASCSWASPRMRRESATNAALRTRMDVSRMARALSFSTTPAAVATRLGARAATASTAASRSLAASRSCLRALRFSIFRSLSSCSSSESSSSSESESSGSRGGGSPSWIIRAGPSVRISCIWVSIDSSTPCVSRAASSVACSGLLKRFPRLLKKPSACIRTPWPVSLAVRRERRLATVSACSSPCGPTRRSFARFCIARSCIEESTASSGSYARLAFSSSPL
mmetsp:Transcript_6441/g.21533  ORF Transcript_6441/g.21533 Transcript_6441/m.21533 type:complete len:236 (-) Transcript_6441:248-955(-)